MALTGCSKPAEKPETAASEAKAPAASGDTIKVGILSIKSGQILLDGKDISQLSPEHRGRAGLAYVPQGRDIFSTLTVEENILIGMAKFSGAKTKKVPEYPYDFFPILNEMKHRCGGDLSGGQQQQLAI